MMKIKLFILLLIVLNASIIKGQTIYETTEGHIIMVAEVDGKQVIAESHKLLILLDSKTREVSGSLDLNTLATGLKYLDKRLQGLENERSRVTFSGIIPIENFIDQPHLPVSFNWPIKLVIDNQNYSVSLKGTLTHFNGGKALACMLSASSDISSDMIGLKRVYPEVSDVVRIQFTQAILRKSDQ
jgi:hypothetical protein